MPLSASGKRVVAPLRRPGTQGRVAWREPLLLALLLASLLSSAVTQAALSVSIDRPRISMGETARLTLSSDGGEDPADADLTALLEHFEILQRSSSMSTQIINGRQSREQQLVLEVTPRHTGPVTLPPFVVDGVQSNALSLEITPEPEIAAGDDIVLFEAELDRDSVYVQGQVLLTLRVQQAVNLDSRSVTELDIPGAFVKTLGQNSFQRSVDGRPWLVHEIRYAIFPETSGELRIPAQTFSGRLSSGRRSLFDTRPSGRLIRRSTEEQVIEVKPRPGGFPDSLWLPAAALAIEEQWSAPPETLRVGDSVTRTVTVTGSGLQGAQLPPVTVDTPPGLRAYPDQPVINDMEGEDGVTGIRSDSVALVAVRAGDYELPPVTLRWWDTERDQLREATLPGRRIRVEAAPAPAGSAPAPQVEVPTTAPSSPDAATPVTAGYWPGIAAFCALGWLATALWAAGRRPRPSTQRDAAGETRNERSARDQLLKACKAQDAQDAHRALRLWLRARGHSGTLRQWLASETSGDEATALARAIADLEACLYSLEAAARWNGDALEQAVRRWRPASGTAERGPLPPLYPSSARS